MTGILKYALIGAFSGALFGAWNFLLLPELPGEETPFWEFLEMISNETGAGLFYGVIAGFFLRRSLDFSRLHWLPFIIVSGASYLAAVRFAIMLYQPGIGDLQTALIGAAAGFVGALSLSGATAFLARKARRPAFFIATTIAGAAVGLLLPVGLNSEADATWIAFFALWQAAYAAASAWGARLS